MAFLYSVRLAAHAILPGASTFSGGTVPVGYIWVLRDLDICWYPGATISSADLQLYTQGGTDNPHIWAASLEALGTFGYESWRGRVIMEAGDNWALNNTGPNACDFQLSGYQLSAP